MIKTILWDFLNFLKKPDDTQAKVSVKTKLIYTGLLLVINLIITIIFIVPVLQKIDDALNLSVTNDEYYTFLKSVFLFSVLAPVMEEFIFRYFLRYNGFNTKIISIQKWKKVFPYLVYSSSICFGFVHLSNYTNSSNLFYMLSPIIILSQLAGGLILSFIRVRLNFIWGVLYHALWNFTVIIAIPVVLDSFTEPYTEHTEEYTITIEEPLFIDENIVHYIKIDSTQGKIQRVAVKQYYLQDLLDTLYTKEKYNGGKILINLDLTSKDGIKEEELIKILEKEYDIE